MGRHHACHCRRSPYFFLFVLTGCLDTARIKRAPLHPTAEEEQQTNVPGVPFYVKVAQCKQETTWLQPYYALTLKKTITTKFADEAWAKDQDEGARRGAKLAPGRQPTFRLVTSARRSTRGARRRPCCRLPRSPSEPRYFPWSDCHQKPEVHTLQVEISSYNSAAISAPSDADKIDGLWKTILSWQFYLPLAVKEDEW